MNLAFAEAGHSGFVEAVDLGCVGTLLVLHAIVRVQGLLTAGHRFRGKLAFQCAVQDAGDGPQAFDGLLGFAQSAIF